MGKFVDLTKKGKANREAARARMPAVRLAGQSAVELRRAKLEGGIRVPRKGEWQTARENSTDVPGVPKTKVLRTIAPPLTDGGLLELAYDKAGGLSNAALAIKYGASESYIADALKRVATSSGTGKKVLEGIVLDGAIASGMKAQKHIDELSPMQAVAATSILTQRFIELNKHNAATSTEEVDLVEIQRLGSFVHELDTAMGAIADIADESEGRVD